MAYFYKLTQILKKTQICLFTKFGLTDASLTFLVNDYCILTDDERLCSVLYGLKADNVYQFEFVKHLDSLF